jgi:proteasome lid subunit RPN8/RPN11
MDRMLFELSTRTRGPVSKLVIDLEKRVRKLSERHLRQLRPTLDSYPLCEPALLALNTTSQVRSCIRDLRDGGDFRAPSVLMELERLQALIQRTVLHLKVIHSWDPAWLVLQGVNRELALTEDALRPLVPPVAPPAMEPPAGVYIPTELLFEACRMLLPPERMALISGRVMDGRTMLTAMFDVTPPGSVNAGHVHGDPKQLAHTLITMEQSGSYLAAWIHSHPWQGPDATTPSSTDRRQYADLVRHYTADLVGLIVVADRYVRVWGDAMESGRIKVHFVGSGVEAVKEAQHVYRLI